jgi:hypothetical protein
MAGEKHDEIILIQVRSNSYAYLTLSFIQRFHSYRKKVNIPYKITEKMKLNIRS